MSNQQPIVTQMDTTGSGGSDSPADEGEGGCRRRRVNRPSRWRRRRRNRPGRWRATSRNRRGICVGQTRSEVRSQADEGAKRVAGGMRTVGQQLQALSEGRRQDAGPLADYADQARRKVDEVASRLDRDGIDGVIAELSGFARRRPGLFLLACAGAGFALARLVRSQAAAGDASGSGGNGAATPTMIGGSTRSLSAGGGTPVAVGLRLSSLP